LLIGGILSKKKKINDFKQKNAMISYILAPQHKRRQILFLGDAIALFTSLYISQFIKLYAVYNEKGLDIVAGKILQEPVSLPILSIAAIQLFIFLLLDVYSQNSFQQSTRGFAKIAAIIVLTGLVVSSMQYVISEYTVNRKIIVAHIPISIALVLWWRIIFYKYLVRVFDEEKIALLLHSDSSIEWISQIKKHLPHWARIVHTEFCDDNVMCSGDAPHLARLNGLLERRDYGTLLVDCSAVKLSSPEVQWILKQKYTGTTVLDLAVYYQELTGRVPLKHINERWLLNAYLLSNGQSKAYPRIKRCLDLGLASALLTVFSPLLVLIAIAVRADSRGPVLYRQERLGRHRIPFTCYKFRTMRTDAESDTGPVWSNENDSRITRIGGVLRKSRLDELPQLFNIIKGDMSFVGPRPIREHFAKTYAEDIPFYWLRYDVQPGVTGWAQAHNCYAVPDALKAFEYELFYMRNMSLLMDLVIVYKTIQALIFFRGK